MFAENTKPEAKREEVAKLLTFEGTKEQNREQIKEFELFKEYLQSQREEMAHLNRVALMGEMTASVAHELNQPLAAIANNASAARRFLEAWGNS
mgnify:CR=1 FL=1